MLRIAAAVLGSATCSRKEPEREPIVHVQAAQVHRMTMQRKIAAEAILFPLNQSAIVPKISAPVRKFYVNRGSRVRAGQLLAVLENRDLAAAMVENKGAYEQAKATYENTIRTSVPEEIQKAELDVKGARDAFDAEQKLYDSRKMLYEQGALPRKDFDQAAVSLTQARNQYEIAQKHLQGLQAVGQQEVLKAAAAQLEAARGKYMGAEAQLGYSEIRSPISGIVADRPLYEGEMASAGSPIVTVIDLSKLVARAHLPQQEAAQLKLGDRATIFTATSGALEETDDVQGKVTVLSPALDPSSTTVEVWVEVANPGERLRPSDTVRLSILGQTIPDAVVVPASALLTAPDGTTMVMVIGSDGRAHQRSVKVGIRQGNEVQITEALAPAEVVVSRGAYGLPDNTKIEVEPATAGVEKPARGKQPVRESK